LARAIAAINYNLAIQQSQ